jgi:hypothetical protein
LGVYATQLEIKKPPPTKTTNHTTIGPTQKNKKKKKKKIAESKRVCAEELYETAGSEVP